MVPEVVVTHIDLDSAEVDIGGVCTDLVQEVSVMGYNDNCIWETEKEIFQPGDGFQVQVVGRFVQQQDVRAAEQRLGQQYAHLVTAFQFFHLFGAQLFRYAKPVQQNCRF